MALLNPEVLAAIQSLQDPLRVPVNEPGYLPQVQDTSVRPVRNPYQAPEVNPMSTRAQEALLSKFQTRPTQTDPGFTNKLISGLAGLSTGWEAGAGPGLQVANAYRETPYRRSLAQWEAEASPLQAAALAETQQNKYGLDRSKILADIANEQATHSLNAYGEQTKAEQAETARYGEQRLRTTENRNLWEATHPMGNVQTAAVGPTGKKNEIVVVNPRNAKTIGTGVEGFPKFRPLQDILDMIDQRNEGLKDLFKGIPENQTHAALENAYRAVAYEAPDKYAQFVDKATGYLKPAVEIQKMIRDPATALLYEDYKKRASQRAEQELSKHRKGTEGYTVRPGLSLGDGLVIGGAEAPQE